MKTTKIITAIVALLMSVYYFFKRRDIIEELFKLGFSAVPLGQLLTPVILLTIGIVLLTVKQKNND